MPPATDTVAAIGLDGADFEIINPLLEAGRMPVLAGLMASGAWGRLRSVTPPVSSAAWTSMCTGVNPGVHGLLGFARPAPGSYASEIISSADVKALQLWDILRSAGRRCLVTNLPSLYPPVDVNGIMVAGMLTPDASSAWCCPADLQARLAAEGIGFVPRPTVSRLHGLSAEAATNLLNELADRQARTVLALLEEADWGLVFSVLDTGDLAQHAYLGMASRQAQRTGKSLLEAPSGQIIADHFAHLDGLLGAILKALPAGATAMVVSDHGFGAKPAIIYLNQWLQSQGYLEPSRFINAGANATNWRKRRLAELLAKLKLGALSRMLPEHVRQREVAVPRIGRMLTAHAPVWARTRAFLDPTALGAGIRINLRGREPEGIVAPGAEYESLREELIERLGRIVDPAGAGPVVTHAWKREDIHPGPHATHEPDIIMQFREDFRSAHTYGKQVFGTARDDQAAWHSEVGIVAATGPGIVAGEMPEQDIRSIAAGVLALLGISPPAHMEAPPPDCIDLGACGDLLPVDTGKTDCGEIGQADEDTDTVAARLRDLGYL